METSKKGLTALITGATSGIGHELTKLFAKDGYNLLLIAENEEKLQQSSAEMSQIGAGTITTIVKDLSKHGAAEELYQDISNRNLTVNVLVNDAGVGNYGLFAESDLQADVNMVHLNVITVMTLTKLFVKEMLKRNEGKILQLGSIASFVPHPWLATYAATKAFVLSFSESLQHEIKDSAVTITIMCPGATDTNFFSRAGADNAKIKQTGPLDEPADVALQGYKALQAGDKRIIIGWQNKAQVAASNVLPDSLVASMMASQLEPVNDLK